MHSARLRGAGCPLAVTFLKECRLDKLRAIRRDYFLVTVAIVYFSKVGSRHLRSLMKRKRLHRSLDVFGRQFMSAREEHAGRVIPTRHDGTFPREWWDLLRTVSRE